MLHVVAVDEQDACEQFVEAFTRDSSDRGLDEARKRGRALPVTHGIIAGDAATVAEEVDQLTREAAHAEQQAAVWNDAAGQFARLCEQQTAELHQLEQVAETTQATAQQATPKPALLRHRSSDRRGRRCAARAHATQAQQEARSAAGSVAGVPSATPRLLRAREQARGRAEQRWGSAPRGPHEVESWSSASASSAPAKTPRCATRAAATAA
ncbi:MAG: hypothetical protein R2722_18420 [Tessaracoccus sp.]